MHLKHLDADRLRNLEAVSLDLPRGLCLLTGSNGQGKSSLLEAVYLLGTGRSFRTRRSAELIAWNGGPLRVVGELSSAAGDRRLSVIMDGDRRSLMIDGVDRELVHFLGSLDVVDLTGERMGVLRGGPVERRRFLDRGIVGLRPSYLKSIGEYRRVLQHRNSALRSASSAEHLRVWDERLVAAAGEIHRRRREYALRLASRLGEVGDVLFPGGDELRAGYRPSPAASRSRGPEQFEAVFRESMEKSRERDRGLGFTSTGPHRDEMAIELGGRDLLKYGSAGQLRASLIALKLGKLSLVREERGEPPLFLMDDFDSDLDQVRMADLARFLTEGGFQALVASSKETLAEGLGVSVMQVRVQAGTARVL